MRVLEEALHMPTDDRAMIAERLIASLDSEADPESEILWQQEIRKRLADSVNEQVEFLPWADVRRKIKRACRGTSR